MKQILDLRVVAAERLNSRYVLLRLTAECRMPDMEPGQFVEVRIDGSSSTFLRRPISIHFFDREKNELWLLVAAVGEGTRWLYQLEAGDMVNVVLPLGHGFSLPNANSQGQRRFLLVGGGVGVAPLLYLGACLKERGAEPTFLLGARTAADLLQLEQFQQYGRVLLTTEDGSQGERGFVTDHSVWQQERFDMISVCGPGPMMHAVARKAAESKTECEVSLENMMACGLGACLCCVEKVRKGVQGQESFTNVCVCKEGPVFNVKRLLWQI